MREAIGIPELAVERDASVRDDRSGEAGDSAVTRTYGQILDMILSFELKPGERVNETEVARKLGVSRTPLREGLNRLVTEGFLVSRPAKGFFCRQIDAEEIFQLYQLRSAIEVGGVRLAVGLATEAEIADLATFLKSSREASEATRTTQLALDETFHERLMMLSGNDEMLSMLRWINRKIRSVRWVDLSRSGREATQQEHGDILEALARRDVVECCRVLEEHIAQRLDQIDSSIREVFGRIYAGPQR